MTLTSLAPVKQAIVKALRANVALKAAVSNEIHEGIAPEDTDYPFVVYDIAFGTRMYNWSNVVTRVTFDVFVISRDQVQAHDLDQLVIEALQDQELVTVSSGLTGLYCRRIQDLSAVDLDDEGRRVYQVGGMYQTWTDQSL